MHSHFLLCELISVLATFDFIFCSLEMMMVCVATHLKHATPKRIKEVEGRKEKHIPFTPCIFPSSTFALLKFYAEFFFIIFLIYETVFIIFILFEQREVLSKGAWPRPRPSLPGAHSIRSVSATSNKQQQQKHLRWKLTKQHPQTSC